MRTKQHYLRLLESNPDAGVGFALAASAVYAARYGSCEPVDHGTDAWKRIARRLKSEYGENLTPDKVRAEMESPDEDETRDFMLRTRLTNSEHLRLLADADQWDRPREAKEPDVSKYVRHKLFG